MSEQPRTTVRLNYRDIQRIKNRQRKIRSVVISVLFVLLVVIVARMATAQSMKPRAFLPIVNNNLPYILGDPPMMCGLPGTEACP
jgi:hypothetical protein